MLVSFGRKSSCAAKKRNESGAGSKPSENFASLQICRSDLIRREEFEFQASLWALIYTIQAEMTFGGMPGHTTDWIVASLATKQAAVAVVAVLRILN